MRRCGRPDPILQRARTEENRSDDVECTIRNQLSDATQFREDRLVAVFSEPSEFKNGPFGFLSHRGLKYRVCHDGGSQVQAVREGKIKGRTLRRGTVVCFQ